MTSRLRLTGRGLRVALVAIVAPVIVFGALHPAIRGGARGWRPSEAHAEARLRTRIPAPAPGPMATVAANLFGAEPFPRVPPFFLRAKSAAERRRATECLANAVYYEAALEPLDGQRAVAQVVLNRVRDPNFPHSVCGVVYQGWDRPTGCQFSFTCDGSLLRPPIPSLLAQARSVAGQALDGFVLPAVGTATHYHAADIDPWWRPTVIRVARVGSHVFYRWPGEAGLSGAFHQAYAGDELALSQAVIDGRAARPVPSTAAPQSPLSPAQLFSTGAAWPLAPTSTSEGRTQRVHVVMAMASTARRQPTPEEVTQINAALARFAGDQGRAEPTPPSDTEARASPPAN